MTRIKCGVELGYVYLSCPNCEFTESLGVDESRHHFQSLFVTQWYPDEEGVNEVSVHKCRQCSDEFEVEWDYDNIL